MNTIAKSDVVDSVNAIFEEAVRAKIDQWTDQCLLQLLEWYFKNRCPIGTPTEILNAYKKSHRC